MRPTQNVKSLIGLWGLALVFFVSSCTQFEGADPSQDSANSNAISSDDPNARLLGCEGPLVEPDLWDGATNGNGGNASCSGDFEFSTGRNNYEEGDFTLSWPDGLEVVVTGGKYISWSFDPPGFCVDGMTVIVKGGNASNIYEYEPGVTSDCGLTSPLTGSGKKITIAALSNLTFCYNLTEKPEAPEAEDQFAEYCEDEIIEPLCAEATAPEGADIVWYTSETGDELATETCLTDFGTLELWAASVIGECESEERTMVTLTIAEEENCGTIIDEDPDDPTCYQEETAWGGDYDGDGPAWWFYFDTEGPATQEIYAGQNATNGEITFDGTKFIIDLGSWVLQPGGESVKIQGYDILPDFRPAAGLFTTYKGDDLEVPVDGTHRYYAIHLDVMIEVDCPE